MLESSRVRGKGNFLLAAITAKMAQQKSPAHRIITAETVGFEQVWEIRQSARWEELLLFGTEFRKKVWKRLFELTVIATLCHLVIPKESIDYLREVREKAQSTIFKGDDICMANMLCDKGIDFGEYALGRSLKRELIQLEHSHFFSDFY